MSSGKNTHIVNGWKAFSYFCCSAWNDSYLIDISKAEAAGDLGTQRSQFVPVTQIYKSIDNLMHRFHYFTWRELINSIPEKEQDERIKNYEAFKNLRNEYLFQSKDINTIKFRYQKQLFPKFIKLGTQNSYPYPDVIKEEIDSGNERFKILYENGKPYSRKDSKDLEMENYSISEEDKNWSISEFMDRLLNENYKDYIK